MDATIAMSSTQPSIDTTAGLPFFELLEGPCQVSSDGLCISDGSGDANYQVNQLCLFSVLRETVLSVVQYDTEPCCDYLTISGVQYRFGETPNGLRVQPSTRIGWSSDESETRGGFTVCANQFSQTTTTTTTTTTNTVTTTTTLTTTTNTPVTA